MLWITSADLPLPYLQVTHSHPVQILPHHTAYPLFHKPYDYDNYFSQR